METKEKTFEISVAKIFGLSTLMILIISLYNLISGSSDDNLSWTLLVPFSISALIYIGICAKDVSQKGVKFLIYHEKIKTAKPLPEKVKPAEKEADEKENKKQAMKEKEVKRTEKERYSTSSIKTRWFIIPFLIFLGVGLYIAITYLSNGKNYPMDSFNIIILILGALGLLNILGLSLQNEWEEIRKIKMEIHDEDPEYKFYDNYDYELVYTDSELNYLIFKFSKVLAYILGLAGLIILIVVGFYLLGNISIPPTTIIIILLVLIYSRLNKNEN